MGMGRVSCYRAETDGMRGLVTDVSQKEQNIHLGVGKGTVVEEGAPPTWLCWCSAGGWTIVLSKMVMGHEGGEVEVPSYPRIG